MAGGKNRCIIVTAHKGVGDISGIEEHHHRLRQQDNGDRQRQRGQLPQLQVKQGNSKEDGERGIAEDINGAVKHIELEGTSEDIAQDNATA